MITSKEELEFLYREVIKSVPQWVLIMGLCEHMWCHQGIEAIASTLGSPLEVEYMWMEWGHGIRLCTLIEYNPLLPTTISVVSGRIGQE